LIIGGSSNPNDKIQNPRGYGYGKSDSGFNNTEF
jgi:hypothetical protein